MPKKFFKIPILTALIAGSLSGLAAPVAQAEQLVIDGTTYWTLDEVMREGEEYLKHKEICNEDFECEEYLKSAYDLAGGIHQAAVNFLSTPFTVTAVNPSRGTVKVIFHDETDMRMPGMPSTKDVVKNLYLYWWDDQTPLAKINYLKMARPNEHEIYTYEAKDGEAWLPANEEVELKVIDSALPNLKTNLLISFFESENSAGHAMRSWGDCLTSIWELEGYECRAVFDKNAVTAYQPFAIEEPIEPSTPDENTEIDNPTENNSSENSTEPTVSTPTTDSANSTVTSVTSTTVIRVPTYIYRTLETTENSKNTENSTSNTENTIAAVSAQETGENTQNTDDNYIEVPLAANKTEEKQFPWWIIVFILSGIALILWWLIPARKRREN